MIRPVRFVVIAFAIILLTACSGPSAPDEPSPIPSPTKTATVAAEATATPTPSPTPSPTPAPTATPQPTATPTPQPTPTPSPTPQLAPTPIPAAPAITVKQADTTQKIIALTFDAGGDAGHTVEILDLLKKQGIKATFALTGRWAEQNPDLVKRIVADGHQIMNYTYDHKSFTGFSTGQPALTTQQRVDEMSRMRDVVLAATGYDVKPYFRAPYGDVDGSVLQDIADAGYSVNVMWSLDTLGWSGLKADEIVKSTVSGAAPGAIVVMDVGSQSEDAAALPRVIQQLRAGGYAFVTVKQMVGR